MKLKIDKKFQIPKDPRKNLAVDFDGVIFSKGQLVPGAVEAIEFLRKKYRIVIFTSREAGNEQSAIASFCSQHKIVFDEITNRKPKNMAYLIDDRAIAFTNWTDIIQLL